MRTLPQRAVTMPIKLDHFCDCESSVDVSVVVHAASANGTAGGMYMMSDVSADKGRRDEGRWKACYRIVFIYNRVGAAVE